jgi:cell fate (sporulation/competence/biofilm development) regulator YmcA (YheA/YmcA/DUF963 family)
MMKKLYYWITVVPLIILAGTLFSLYSGQANMNKDMQSVFNKQLHAWGYMHTQSVVKYEEKIKLLERHAVNMEEHHKKEIGEVVKFYTDVLEEAKD